RGARGDEIAGTKTTKATLEYESIGEGTLAKIVVPEGTNDVRVNQLIAVLAQEGEDVKAPAAAAAKASPAAKAPSPVAATPKPAQPAVSAVAAAAKVSPAAPLPADTPATATAPARGQWRRLGQTRDP